MTKHFKRPKSEDELNQREAKGLWRALSLAKEVGEGDRKITLEVILELHKAMFEDVVPEMAGRFRKNGEDIKKLKCIEPPPGRMVYEKMYSFWRELDSRISKIERHPKFKNKRSKIKWSNLVLDLATWVQYQIAAIHPFCNGNGRMARMMTNLILRRYGLQGTDVQYEGVDKEKYLNALCMVDLYNNYETLKNLILRSMKNTYTKIRKVYINNARAKRKS